MIFNSKLPTAKKFKHWVTSEVLPSIRKTGSYSTPIVSNIDILKENLEVATVIGEALKLDNKEIVKYANNATKNATGVDYVSRLGIDL